MDGKWKQKVNYIKNTKFKVYRMCSKFIIHKFTSLIKVVSQSSYNSL